MQKSNKGRLSSKLTNNQSQQQVPSGGGKVGQPRSSTSTLEANPSQTSGGPNYYLNGRAGTNLIGQ